MSDDTNVVVSTEAPQALKSNDTSSKVQEPVVTTKTAPKVVEKVEAKAEAVTKPPEGESNASDAASLAENPSKNRESRKVKESLERMRRTTEARVRAEVLKEIQDRQSLSPESVSDQPKEKTLADFDFDQDKYIAYRVERVVQAQTEHQKQAAAQESFKAHVDAFEEKAGDGAWDDIVSSALNLDPSYKALTELFMGDEHDLEIAHHLATNMKEAERIKALPRLQQVREIAKLAEQFEGITEEAPVVVPKKTTSAPPPVKTISGAGKPSVDIHDAGMSTADRIKAWKKQGRR